MYGVSMRSVYGVSAQRSVYGNQCTASVYDQCTASVFGDQYMASVYNQCTAISVRRQRISERSFDADLRDVSAEGMLAS